MAFPRAGRVDLDRHEHRDHRPGKIWCSAATADVAARYGITVAGI